jgi:microcystin degradation protein MlrC
MARIAVAGSQHETNTFVPQTTSYEDFETSAYFGGPRRGPELLELAPGPSPLGGFIARAAELGHEVVPLFYASAEPGGLIGRSCFERISNEIVSALASAGRIDAVYLDLHGAMTAEGIDDGDAELLQRVRSVVGEIPLVCSFDLHGNLTRDTIACADAAVAYRTYPHVDAAETGAAAADLVARRLDGGLRPYLAFRKLPFLIPLDRQSTFHEPARSVYDQLPMLERKHGLWSVSLMMGFLQSDLEFVGPSIFAYADTAAQANEAADELLQMLLDREQEFQSKLVSPAEAAAEAAAWSGAGPLILADVHDNAGGGASSDTMDLTKALLAERVSDVAVAMVHDEAAVDAAFAAGEGEYVDLQLGGRGVPGDEPLAARFLVEKLNELPVLATGPVAKGSSIDLGRTVLLRIDGVRIVVTSRRTQCLDQAYFRHLGIEPAATKVLVVKSSNHFRADFEPIAGKVTGVAGIGMCTANPAFIPYTRLRPDVRLFGGGPTLGR